MHSDSAGGLRSVRVQSQAADGRGGIGNTQEEERSRELDEREAEVPRERGSEQEELDFVQRGGVPAEAKGRGKKDRNERKTAIQVASLNINGFGNLIRDHPDNKWGRIYRMMSEHRIGILLLQETHLTEERVAGIHKMFARKIRVIFSANAESPTQREGVAVVLNSRYVDTKSAVAQAIVPGKAIQVSLTCQGGDTKNILCIYAPTSHGIAERKLFFEEVRKYYEAHKECQKPHLMAGDFNNVEDSIDRLPITEGPDQSVPALDDLKLSLGLMIADGWRVTYPNTREYSFHRGVGDEAVFSRLDRIYVTPEVFDNAREWRICEAGVRTDHSLVLVQLTPKNAPVVGKGRPTFPLQLIKDKKLAKMIKERGLIAMQELKALQESGTRNESANPQRILCEFKTAAMKLARVREKLIVPKLLADIRERERALRQTKANRIMEEKTKLAEAEALTKQIRQLKQRRYKQQQQNSRATHRLFGDRPTKYWSRLLVLQGPVKSGFLTPRGSNRGPQLNQTTYRSGYKHLEPNKS
ncbi:DNase I-like protein [Polyporus arcularius HHB13444]|uniref:DNase I-like protein n=1 Tax=Polyporus arcularius HHB13444 TaxID=1314778 RepID=A0A5C3NU73_9APHY|nr:DNase I-like protein [Polyporus arcularius HHB13444]